MALIGANPTFRPAHPRLTSRNFAKCSKFRALNFWWQVQFTTENVHPGTHRLWKETQYRCRAEHDDRRHQGRTPATRGHLGSPTTSLVPRAEPARPDNDR